jgi:hypothetical protein
MRAVMCKENNTERHLTACFERYFFKEHQFYLTRLSGKLEVAGLVEHIMAVNIDLAGTTGIRQLSDCRMITDVSNLSVADATQCTMLEKQKTNSVLALLVPDNPVFYGIARACSMFLDASRKDVQVFRDFEKAISWLSRDTSDFDMIMKLINTTGCIHTL